MTHTSVYGRENILDKKFSKSDEAHRPIFLTCMEPTLKRAAFFMKFTKGENFNPIGLATMQYCSMPANFIFIKSKQIFV